MEARIAPKSRIVHNLGQEQQIPNEDEPLIVSEEVGEGEVKEETKIELDVKSGKFLTQNLGVLHVAQVVAAPDQEEHLHVEDDEEHDVGQGGTDEEEITALS